MTNIEHNNIEQGYATSGAPLPHTPRDATSDGFLVRLFERLGRRYGWTNLLELAKNRGDVRRTFQSLPARMHKVANQTALIIELVDDYRTGVYREIPWRSLLVLAGVAAYVVSPIDLIPDVLGSFGVLDDMVLIAFASRLMRHDLEAYCHFKNYAIEDYF